MIIIEGPDNTGKTTLIDQLSKEFNLPTIKSYRPPNLEAITRFHHWAKAAPVTPLMDRHPAISDLVYGPILRDHTSSDPELVRSLRDQAYLVYCAPPLSTIQGSYLDRPQLEGTHENLEAIISEYESLMSTLEPDFIYDFTKPKAFKTLCSHIQRALRRF